MFGVARRECVIFALLVDMVARYVKLHVSLSDVVQVRGDVVAVLGDKLNFRFFLVIYGRVAL